MSTINLESGFCLFGHLRPSCVLRFLNSFLLLLRDQAEVACDLTANFLEVLKFTLKLLSRLPLLGQLLLQLRNVGSSTHITDLRR